ncbi:MAG: LptA/OstA family protein [Euryarchaeota archaeon]|nr:LptA/OstA family protein [Euryarchaeota archaeon]
MIKNLLIILCLIPAGSAAASSPPATPFTIPGGQKALEFVRYIPDKKGDMTWELQGESARLIDPVHMEITELVALSHDPKVGFLKITVDRFLYDSQAREGRAEKERVTVRREKMVLTGKGLLWWADQKHLRILEDVRLLLQEKDGSGLFPFDLPALSPGKAASGPAPTPPEDWTVITCDGNLFMNYQKNKITFYRNVRVDNPRGNLRSDQLIIFVSSSEKKIEKMEAFGNIDIRMGSRRGSSEKVLYLPEEKKVILLGDAMIRDKKNQVRGEKITFYLDREEMEVSSASDIKLVPDEDMEFDLGD